MRSRFWILLLAVAIVLFIAEPNFAQCAMCRQTLENAAGAKQAASTMNLAILVLFIPPVAMFVGIFGLIYRYRNFQGYQNREFLSDGK
ncbi:MAG: hypothetical protein AB1757_18755 [Acidobacteriota bacterium]